MTLAGDPSDPRRQRPVERVEAVRTELLDRLQDPRGVREQVGHVDTLTGRRERPQIVGAPGEHVDRPVMVQTLHVIQGDPDLEDALIQRADRARFLPPEVFQCLVLLKELAAVELRDPVSQEGGRRLVTRIHHNACSFIQQRLIDAMTMLNAAATEAIASGIIKAPKKRRKR